MVVTFPTLNRVFFLLAFVCLLGSFSYAQNSVSKQIGPYISSQVLEDGVLIEAENAKVRLQVYGPNIVRVRTTQGEFSERNTPAVILGTKGAKFSITENFDRLVLKTDSLQIFVSKKRVVLGFFTLKNQMLTMDEPSFGTSWLGTEVTNYKKLFPDERFIGMGEKTGNINNRRGQVLVNKNSDSPSYGINTDPLYKSIPFFMSIHNQLTYGIFFDNPYKSTFDFGASSDGQFYSFGAEDGEMNYYFFGAQSFKGILQDYALLTGSQVMPPLWSLGYQQSRWGYTSESQILEVANTFRQKNIPADAIYLDINSTDAHKAFTWNYKNFKDPKNMIKLLNGMGFHMVNMVDPGIKIEKGYPVYDEGIGRSYFAKYANGQYYAGEVWTDRCHLPDFTREEVRKWWGEKLEPFTSVGVEGFGNNMNEPAVFGRNIPSIVEFGGKEHKISIKEVHNTYGNLMSQATYEGAKKALDKRPFVMSRAAYAGIQRYAAVWTGDNLASDEHMLLGQRLVTSLGYSGVGFSGVDIGGFSGEPSPELMTRWMSLGTFSPLFRNHSANTVGLREPWRFGEEKEAIMKKDIETRYKLLPYIYSTFYQSKLYGLPISRGLPIHYSDDEKVYLPEYQNQFHFGEAFLVNPVESTKETAKVYLPEGGWYRFSTDEYFEGPKEFEVPAPLNDLPVFVKASSIVPMQKVVQHSGENPGSVLTVHLWNGSDSSEFMYYEDDGKSFDAEKSGFYRRKIRYDSERRLLFFDAVEGRFPSSFTKIMLVLHGFKGQVKMVKVNGVTQPMRVDARINTSSTEIDNINKMIIVGLN